MVDRVVFLGGMPYQRVVPYYLAAEALWFPSNARSEAFGIAEVEAMASGCPVINTNIPHSGVSWVSIQSQRISISLNGQYFGEELIVETAPNHLAS